MSLSWVFAGRELRSGVRGFRIFLACLALGVAALAAAGSTAQAFREGLAAQSRSILGGDLSVSVEGRTFTSTERAAIEALGRTSDTLRVRAMAGGATATRRLAEVRGVDAAYPLAGTVVLRGATNLSKALTMNDGPPGAALDPDLMTRLGLHVGDAFRLGDTAFRVRAILVTEPDRLGRGFSLGPSILVSRSALVRSGLMQDDALYGETLRLALPSSVDPVLAAKQLMGRFPSAGLRVRGRNDAAAGLGRLIDQLEFFLGLIGLAALLAGGLGVWSAVSAYLAARRSTIAVLKALGADGALVRNTFLLQIGALALVGVALGLAVGAASPFLLGWIAKDRLPVPVLFSLYPLPLIKAGVFGVLAAAAFSLAPLGRARATPPSALLRRELGTRMAFGPEVLGACAAALGLGVLTVATAPSILVAVVALAGLGIAFGALFALGQGAVRAAAWARQFTGGVVRIGLANLSGPGSAARTAAPSIGFGIALLTAVVLIQSSLLREVKDVAPSQAPSLIMTQIPPEDASKVDADVSASIGPLTPERYRRYPFATGRIIALKGRPIDRAKIAPGVRWAFDADLTLSDLGPAPPDASLVAGAWWPKDYVGPPLIALDEDIARGAGLHVGDELTVSLLGRDLVVKIACLRKLDWSRFGANFPLILDAAALQGANLREIALVKADAPATTVIMAQVGRDFPGVNMISVREQLDAAAKIFDQLSWAVRGAAGVAALAGLLVLVGAVAATAQARAREAAVLKVLGATRLQLLATYGVEYGVVGLLAGGAGVLLGSAAAFPVTTLVFKASFAVDWGGVFALLLAAALMAMIVGGSGAYISLSRRPAPVLRSE